MNDIRGSFLVAKVSFCDLCLVSKGVIESITPERLFVTQCTLPGAAIREMFWDSGAVGVREFVGGEAADVAGSSPFDTSDAVITSRKLDDVAGLESGGRGDFQPFGRETEVREGERGEGQGYGFNAGRRVGYGSLCCGRVVAEYRENVSEYRACNGFDSGYVIFGMRFADETAGFYRGCCLAG